MAQPLKTQKGFEMSVEARGFLVRSMRQQVDISLRMAEAYAAYWRGVCEAMARTRGAPVPAATRRKRGKP